SLSQNYPNPFNPITNIKYEIARNSFVSLKMFNTLGIEIKTLINETKPAGSYEVKWDASEFASGVYFYELQVGDFKERKKMVLIKEVYAGYETYKRFRTGTLFLCPFFF